MATLAAAFAQIANECEREGLTPNNSERIGQEIAKSFNVQPDEVGILKLEKTNLVFVYPGRLHNVGTIPLNTIGSVASRTATTKRAEVINAFAQAKHISVFESIDLGHKSGTDKTTHTIQKLMSVPVVGQEGTLGVIEVCRKGQSAPASGPDFSPAELQRLVSIATALAKCFK
jgi:hypothetical protein